MLIIANEASIWICAKCRFSSSTKTKEESYVIFFTNIGRAVHTKLTLKRQPVVHHGEDSLFDLSSIPGATNYCYILFYIENDKDIGVKAMLFEAIVFEVCCYIEGEVWMEVCKLFLSGANEHIFDKMGLPGNLRNDSNSFFTLITCPCKCIHNVEIFAT